MKGIFYITSIVGSSVLSRGSSNHGRVDLNEQARRGPAKVRLFLEYTGLSKELVPTVEYLDALSRSNVLDRACCVVSSMRGSLLGQWLCRGMPSIGHGVLPAQCGSGPLSLVILHTVAYNVGNDQRESKHTSLGSEGGVAGLLC